ncbi:hypothetical protein N7517_000230 [Penicillium concentricum]|uniref:Cell wall galactomannoprotein n=1 Tax=Penicillium concentricum TaxID=293559 RepID=A0A9W9SR46_9EURO|nr:uncharacterized protein N7517_000230 [Penicillium concentricum]KAJ5382319.1 hypothetical protein N7517_000230 [Penicillium concentricum]
MNLRAILTALSLDVLVASAAGVPATATALTNTLHIMMALSSLTANSAIDIFTWTADHFLPDVYGGFELITTAAENEVVVLSNSQEAVAGAINESMQKEICEMYRAFADVHRILLGVIIGKKDILAMVLSNATAAPPDVLPTIEDRLNECSKAIASLTQLTLPLVPICVGGILDDQRRYNELTEELKLVLH